MEGTRPGRTPSNRATEVGPSFPLLNRCYYLCSHAFPLMLFSFLSLFFSLPALHLLGIQWRLNLGRVGIGGPAEVAR